MFDNFRQSLAWLHTWCGLVLGFVLMVVFFFGSLSVFDREIDRWALTETRIPAQPMPSFDTVLAPLFATITEADADERAEAAARVTEPLPEQLDVMNWSAYTTHRDPVLQLYAEFAVPNSRLPDDHIHGHITIDPRDGRTLPGNRLALGSAFFYPMHFSLHLTWLNLGYWIVGFASIVMLAALISGVVMHRKIFREFFTFRPRKRVMRSTLARIYWNDAVITSDELEVRLASAADQKPQPEIHIRGDRTVEYEHVIRVMAAAQRAGIARLGFVTEPER